MISLLAEHVHVDYGPHDLSIPAAGLTVADARSAYADVLNVGADAEAYVNGELAAPTRMLRGGDRLQFVRPAGRKGQDFWSRREFLRITGLSQSDWDGLVNDGLRFVDAGGEPVIPESEAIKWVRRLVHGEWSVAKVDKAASVGRPGRKTTTADIAEFANARRPQMTWKEIFAEWRRLHPGDERVRTFEQIRDAVRRRYRGKR